MTARLLLTIFLLMSTPILADTNSNSKDSNQVILDSTGIIDSTLASDTTADNERVQRLRDFEERYRENQLAEQKMKIGRLSFHDSLVHYYLPGRLNDRVQKERSFLYDAGDYFRSKPAYFANDYQETPMRNTVQPFSLSGDRLNLIHDGFVLRPFEHTLEPDGLVDLNDIPTALDQDIYTVPGAAGALFGGDNVVASLITVPGKPDSDTPISAFIVDKGSFGLSYARGKYSKKFRDGRLIDLSVGYRNADGSGFGLGDDAYHIFSKVYLPLRDRHGLDATFQWYDRDSRLALRPDVLGLLVDRNRIDRSGKIAFYRYNENGSARTDLGYSYLQQQSELGSPHNGKLYNGKQGGFISRQWAGGKTAYKIEVSASSSKYKDGSSEFERLSASTFLSFSQLKKGGGFAFKAGQNSVEEYGVLPTVAVMYLNDADHTHLLVSAGYAERAPSMYQLHLRNRSLNLYGGIGDYGESGNKNLNREKQLTGSVDAELGSMHNSIGLSVTGGRLTDGINWNEQNTIFSPENRDIKFVSLSSRAKLRVNKYFNLSGGGAYNHVDYENLADRAYSPDYHYFSGGEINIFWKQRLVHLYAYGEIVYTGPYEGFTGRDLGNTAIANAKLSIRMGKFRFHYVFQNIFSQIYEPREFFS